MKTYDFQEANDNIIIIFNEVIFSKYFFVEFSKIQMLLETKKFEEIKIDLTKTLWFDTLACCVLMLTLRKYRDTYKGLITFFLMDTDYYIEHVRFLYYLDLNGFINEIKKIGRIDLTDIEPYISKYKESIMLTQFNLHTCVFPFSIIDSDKYLYDNMDNLNANLQLAIGSDLSQYDFDILVNKVYMFLQESIENVFEHAYEANQNKYCAVIIKKANQNYIHESYLSNKTINRHYKGALNEEDKALDVIAFDKIIKLNTPYANTLSKEKSSFLEIYVVDIGKGIIKSFNNPKDTTDRNIIEKIFTHGERSNKKGKTSVAGGLYMLNNLLAMNNDFIAIKGDYNWFRIKCSDQLYQGDSYTKSRYISNRGTYETNLVTGFSVIGYLGIDKINDKIKDNFISIYKADNFIKKNQLASLLLTSNNQLKLKDVLSYSIFDYRLNKCDFNLDNTEKNTIIILPNKHFSSVTIQNIVYKINENKRIKQIIFGDIPENEINKYYNIFKLNKIKVYKLILISQTLKSVVFKTNLSDNKLYYSYNETIDFVTNLKPSNLDICNSLKLYYELIRLHDSYKMWEIIADIQKHHNKCIYIKNDVIWNDNLLHGYLDFSQISTVPDCRFLCIYQLYRISGMYNEPIYFESAELFTNDICEKVNKLMNNSHTNYKVYISSVFVTGTSMQDTWLHATDKEDDLFYFFCHQTTSDLKAFTLFEWSTNQNWIDNQFDNSDTTYKRIGKTPFIASGGENYFMSKHYDKINDIFELSIDKSYELLQEMNGISTAIIRMGHFNLEDRHDFMHIDTLSLLHKSLIQSKTNPVYKGNCWDYLLCEIYLALYTYNKPSKDKIISDIRGDNGYKLTIQEKINDYFNIKKFKNGIIQDSIVVYLTDFQTSSIIEEIKNQFVTNLQNRIISLPPLIKQRTASSLLLSPLLIETLRNAISEIKLNDKAVVTVFSATTISTRLRKELKHILFRLGATYVKTLTIIDRQRFTMGTYGNGSHRAFLRTDLPDLGAEAICKLCQGTDKIKKLIDKINSNMIKTRMVEIISLWTCVKTSDNYYNIGIKMHPIKLSINLKNKISEMCRFYNVDQFNISTDFGLALFTIENTVISLNSGFIFYCLADEELDDNTKILLISTYLLHFSKQEITEYLQIMLTVKLYELLSQQKYSNIYTSLATVILFAQNSYTKKELYKNLKSNFSSSNIKIKCLDFYIININIYNDFFEKSQIDYDFYFYLKHDDISIPELIYGIALITNYESQHNHSRILIRLKNKGKEFNKYDYIDAMNTIEYLINNYNKLPLSVYYDTMALYELKKLAINHLKDLELIIKNKIEKYDNELSIPNDIYNINNEFLTIGMAINKLLLNNTDNNSTIKNKLEHLANDTISLFGKNKIKSIYIVEPKYLKFSRWYYFYNDILEEIKYFMGDFRHAKNNLIHNIFDLNEGDYSGIIRVDFGDEKSSFIEICFYNYIHDGISVEDIMKIKKSKISRPTMLDFKFFNDKINIKENPSYEIKDINNIFSKRTLIVSLKIPYIDYNTNNKEGIV